jgi:hypothetical protein
MFKHILIHHISVVLQCRERSQIACAPKGALNYALWQAIRNSHMDDLWKMRIHEIDSFRSINSLDRYATSSLKLGLRIARSIQKEIFTLLCDYLCESKDSHEPLLKSVQPLTLSNINTDNCLARPSAPIPGRSQMKAGNREKQFRSLKNHMTRPLILTNGCQSIR